MRINDAQNAMEMYEFQDLEDGDTFMFNGLLCIKCNGGYIGGEKVTAISLNDGESYILSSTDLVYDVNNHAIFRQEQDALYEYYRGDETSLEDADMRQGCGACDDRS